MRENKHSEKSPQRLLTKELADIANMMWWTEALLLNSIETTYGFFADQRNTKQYNAALYLASMRLWYYFDRPKNLAFHDLCTELEPTQNLQSLLGLGLKVYAYP